jgi:hypothetical protein
VFRKFRREFRRVFEGEGFRKKRGKRGRRVGGEEWGKKRKRSV